MSNDLALETLKQLEAALDEYQAGDSNPEAVRAFEGLLKDLRDSAHAPSNLVAEKIGSIRQYIEALYSPRKHGRHGGVDQVKLFIRHDLASLQTIVARGRAGSDSEND
jgi:hypothetical protein